VRSLHLNHRVFDTHMIDLMILVPSLSFVLNISIGASGDHVDCAMGWEIVALVRRLAE
jgi:hypothetical protein